MPQTVHLELRVPFVRNDFVNVMVAVLGGVGRCRSRSPARREVDAVPFRRRQLEDCLALPREREELVGRFCVPPIVNDLEAFAVGVGAARPASSSVLFRTSSSSNADWCEE